jgi:hypothetical protein
MQRLRYPVTRNYEEVSGMGMGDDRDKLQARQIVEPEDNAYYTDLSTSSDEDQGNEQEGRCRITRVCDLVELQFFRSKLIRHFDIAFTRNEIIVWPSSMGERRSDVPMIATTFL